MAQQLPFLRLASPPLQWDSITVPHDKEAQKAMSRLLERELGSVAIQASCLSSESPHRVWCGNELVHAPQTVLEIESTLRAPCTLRFDETKSPSRIRFEEMDLYDEDPLSRHSIYAETGGCGCYLLTSRSNTQSSLLLPLNQRYGIECPIGIQLNSR